MDPKKYAIKNMAITMMTFVGTLGLSFVVRAIFVNKLGSEYLGLNGVFTSILSVLAISDLGLESIFGYLLYKPLVENNHSSIRDMISFVRKVYNFIGFFIFFIGVLIIPWLPMIVGSQGMRLNHVYLIYILLLANSSLSYLFTYNRTILNADQKNYVIATATFTVSLFVSMLQITVLLILQSMVWYVLVLLIGTIVTNVYLSKKVILEYDFLNNLPKRVKLNDTDHKTLIQNTIGGFSNKIGTAVVFASDNILLSIFVNLSTVGIYSNYTLVINGITALFQKVAGAITASIGYISIKSASKSFKIFLQLNFYVTAILFFVSPLIFVALKPLITLWVGHNYILSPFVVFLIVENFVLQVSRTPALTYIDAYGLQWIQKWKSVIESILNIVLSLILLIFFHLGLIAVLLGTVGSTLLFVFWFEMYIVLKHSFNLTKGEQIRVLSSLIFEKLSISVPLLISIYLSDVVVGENVILTSIKLMSMMIVISMIVFLIFFGRRSEVKTFFQNSKKWFSIK